MNFPHVGAMYVLMLEDERSACEDPSGADAQWHIWWRHHPDTHGGMPLVRVQVYGAMEALLSQLEVHPQDGLALHESTDEAEADLILHEARSRGWRGPWAAAPDWLEAHRWVRQAHGPVLEITSWTGFWAEPWAAVGRARPLAEDQREIAQGWASDALPAALAVVWEGAIVAANRAFGSLLGTVPSQLLGMPFARLWATPRESRELIERMSRGARDGRDLSSEVKWIRPDQRTCWVELKCRAVEDSSALAGAWIVVGTDTSRHRRARDFLEIQRNLVECSQDGIAIVDIAENGEKRLVFVNSAWERMTGYRAEEVLGKHPAFLQGGEKDQPAAAVLREAIENHRSANVTLRNFHKDGSEYYIDLSIFPLPVQPGRNLQYVGVKRDVTEKMHTELRLMESERRFRHLFTDNRLPMLLIESSSGRILDANPAALEMYGYTRTEFHRLNWRDLVAEESATSTRPTVGAAGERFGDVSQRHRCADGELRDVLTYSGELQVGEGRMRYAILVDVTAQRRAEAQLQAAMEAARAAAVAKSEFLQIVGHEIRTPMNAIVGFSDLLHSATTPWDSAEAVAMILQGTTELERVLEAMVDFIGWDPEADRADDVEIDHGELPELLLGNWPELAKRKGLAFRIETPGGDGEISVPLADYERILGFIFDNAIKFTEAGEIAAVIAIEASSSTLRVTISDTGLGIPEDRQANLFRPFSCGDAGTERTHGGLGLGLARCRRMADAHGVEIAFQSEVGKGTRFTLRLPYRTSS